MLTRHFSLKTHKNKVKPDTIQFSGRKVCPVKWSRVGHTL
jgi:hypothetical protein